MDMNNLWSDFDLNSKKQNTRCLSVNTILAGKYLVGPVLGQGGFGITYVGYDLNMETQVAIKEYFPVELVSRDTTTMHGDRVLSLSGEKSVTYKQGLKKYVEEAQNVSQFSEVPGIVSVKDFFYENETAYIVMEYIEGQSLKDYLKSKDGRLSEEETLKIMKPVLKALEKVHNAGIIHRDISPDNIMLTFENDGRIREVKLIDFGAARMTAKNDQKSLTIILKHGYAPEEQYRTHGEQGPWTDVYAVCAVLYRMLTGETPMPAMDRMFKDELKSFEALGVKVSKNTEAAILKGLAVKKDDRIQSMRKLIAALYEGAKLKGNDTGKRKVLFLAAGICAVLVIAVAVMALTGNKKTAVTGGETVQETAEENAASVAETMDMQTQEEALGEQIAFPSIEGLVACGYNHIVAVQEDGSVRSYGNNGSGQGDTQDWCHIVQVAVGTDFSMGLHLDGKVRVAGGSDTDGGVQGAESWNGIVQLAAGSYHALGLRQDGTVVSAGENAQGCCDVGDWTDVVKIRAGRYISVGIRSDGTLLVAGGDEEYLDLDTIRGWTDIEEVWVTNYSIYGRKTDGTYLMQSNVESFQTGAFLQQCGQIEQLALIDDCVFCRSADGKFHFSGEGNGYTGALDEAFGWGDTVYLYSGDYCIAGLMPDGTLKAASIDYDRNDFELTDFTDLEVANVSEDLVVGIQRNGNLQYYAAGGWFSPENLGSSPAVQVYENDPGEVLTVRQDGSVYMDIRGKIGTGPDWDHIVQIEDLSGYLFGVTSDGRVVAEDTIINGADWRADVWEECKEALNWTEVSQIAVYGQCLVGLTTDGKLLCTDEYVQQELESVGKAKYIKGNLWNTLAVVLEDGTVFWKGDDEESGQSNVSDWTDIREVAVSRWHTVGLKEDGTVVATGKNNNGMCEVEDWENIRSISVSSSATIGITESGELKFAGMLDNDWRSRKDMKAGISLVQD